MAGKNPEMNVLAEIRFQPFGRISTEIVLPAATRQIEREETIEEAPRLTVRHALIRESTYRIIHS